jgi:hypothetical protein
VKILPSGPPIATRSLSIGFPLLDTVSEAALAIDVRGFARFEAGTNGTLVFRALGETHVIDPLKSRRDKDPASYQSSLKIKVPARSEDLRITFFIAVEQGASKQFGQALLTVGFHRSITPISSRTLRRSRWRSGSATVLSARWRRPRCRSKPVRLLR